ncbi:MAG: LpxL/LpxP family Kdo(2)-lipid IV(A) lauroyl/palmitoleoyl acyltransferase [Candidatus Thiodiazotropha sp. (ex Monitilora ramsayi)]|nr:LpxL/LpxP family Kdo(2)-lipid IV(A) lauroyl/palmitoleoyl acyltransferase [Candidatus Thiodiazotropha sp. (ex Monitilora ramsayi)]
MPSKSNASLFAPRYWSTHTALALLWLICRWLPYGWVIRLGSSLGRIVMRFADRRRHIAEVNLALCFPQESEQQRHSLLQRHFESLGIGLLTTGMAWWASDRHLRGLVEIEGLEYLESAAKEGKGAILLSAHFTDLEMSGRLLSLFHNFAVMYRPHENPVIEAAFRRNRERRFSAAIPRGDVRQMIKTMKQNQAVWYAPDQSYSDPNSTLAPFFGVPASTNLGTARLAKVSAAPVLPFFGYRLPGNQGYRLVVQPPVPDFPSNDPHADTARINGIIEAAVKVASEQYFWVHRRFKNRPGIPDPY